MIHGANGDRHPSGVHDLVSAAKEKNWRLVHQCATPAAVESFVKGILDDPSGGQSEIDSKAVLSAMLEAAVRKDLERPDDSFPNMQSFIETLAGALQRSAGSGNPHHLNSLLPLDANALTMALSSMQLRGMYTQSDKLVLMHLDWILNQISTSTKESRRDVDVSPFLLYLNLLWEPTHERSVKKALMVYCKYLRPDRYKIQKADDALGIIDALCSTPITLSAAPNSSNSTSLSSSSGSSSNNGGYGHHQSSSTSPAPAPSPIDVTNTLKWKSIIAWQYYRDFRASCRNAPFPHESIMLSHIARVSGVCGDWSTLEHVVVAYARHNNAEQKFDLSFVCTVLYALHLIAVRRSLPAEETRKHVRVVMSWLRLNTGGMGDDPRVVDWLVTLALGEWVLTVVEDLSGC